MRICIFTSYFYPEDFKVNDIAFELAKNGHDVTVITAVPNYPKGKFYKGYSIIRRWHEIIKCVEVFRLPVIPRGNGSGLMLVLNYLSHLFCASAFAFLHSFSRRYDAVFVHQGSPATIGIPAGILSHRQGIRMLFWVLDLWPESVQSAGGFRNKTVLAWIRHVMVAIYSASEKILISSRGFEKSILEKGDFRDKIVYFPNWAETIVPSRGFDVTKIEPFCRSDQDNFIIAFTGNMGEAQDLDIVLNAAIFLKSYRTIKWVFVGDGRKRGEFMERASRLSLEDTVFSPGRFPLETMPHFLSHADIMLVSLKDEPVFTMTVPAKLQFYMAHSKAVLAMLNGDGARIVDEAQCGFTVPAGNAEQLANMAVLVSGLGKAEILRLGENGLRYYNATFRKEDRIIQLESLLGLNE